MSARVDLLHQGIVILSVSDRPFDRETPRRRTVASCGKLARNFPADRRLYIGDTMVQYPDLRGGSMLRVNRQEYCYGAAMWLNKFNYYSDFVVYPLAVVALIAADFIHRPQYGGQFSAYRWILACVCGTALWSVLEYGLHRVGLHFMAYFSPMHAQHHADPLGLIGTPAWVSVTV